MASKLATEKAAQIWCTPKTAHIEMNVVLAGAIAEVFDEILSQPWLGNATTRELLGEITARIDVTGQLDYKTVPAK